ncbi:MAG: peptidyl-alpha-hydroxyglycine alpha-amidating lyase family protein [Flavobacteriaceae bacterium]
MNSNQSKSTKKNNKEKLLWAITVGICSISLSCEEPAEPQFSLAVQWPSLSEEFQLGNPTGIGVNSEDQIVVFHRASREWQYPMPETNIGEATLLTLDQQTGTIIHEWGSDTFVMPHGLEVDHQDHIWVTDVALHQVFKFNAEGELLLKLGEERVAGDDSAHFNLPTDVAVAKDGSFYVSDGYGNSRVVKFSKEGEFLMQWGALGDEDGQFVIPHGIDLDDEGNVYVADRENNRIQKFTADGVHLKTWQNETTNQLYSLVVDKSAKRVYGIDYYVLNDSIVLGSDIFELDLELNKLNQFGRSTDYNGPIARYHDIAVDAKGNLYTGDILGNTIQKFEKK